MPCRLLLLPAQPRPQRVPTRLSSATLALLAAACCGAAPGARAARLSIGDRVQLAPHRTSAHNCLQPGQVATITRDDHDSLPYSLNVGCGFFTETDLVAEFERAGLVDTASDAPLLLLSVDVEAAAALPDATVTLRQVYLNGGDDDVREAAYYFPLKSGAAVFRLRAVVTRPDGSRATIETAVEPKKAARRHFAEAVAAGVPAALLERNTESEDVFKVSLGAVPRHASVVVDVSFLAPLGPNADEDHPDLPSWRLVLPNSLLHRYETASDPFRDPAFTVSAAVAATMASVANGIGPLNARLRVRSPRQLLRIYSPSHSAHARAKVDDDNLGAELTISVSALESGEVRASGEGLDFAYKATPRLGDMHFAFTDRAEPAASNLAAVALVVERAAPPGGGWEGFTGAEPSNSTTLAAAVSVTVSAEACDAALRANRAAQPSPVQPPSRGHDYVFVLDCSGSMDGSSMTNAVAALKLALKSVPQKSSSIQIVFFGDNFYTLYPEGPQPLTSETLAEANARLDATGADLGGTEVVRPLEFAMREPSPRGDGDLPPLVDVFFLTDGQVGNTREVIAMVDERVKASGGRLRVHTIGIGNQVSTELVDGLAEAGSGSSAYVTDGEGFRAKMSLLMRAAVDGLPGESHGGHATSNCRVQIEWGAAVISLLGESPAATLEVAVGGGERKRFLNILELPVAAAAAARAGQGPDTALIAAALAQLGAARLTFTHSRTGEAATVALRDAPHTVTVAPAGSVALAQRAVQATLRAIEREEDAALLTEQRSEADRQHELGEAEARGALALESLRGAIDHFAGVGLDTEALRLALSNATDVLAERSRIAAIAAAAASYLGVSGALKRRGEDVSVRWQILGRHTSFFGRASAEEAAGFARAAAEAARSVADSLAQQQSDQQARVARAFAEASDPMQGATQGELDDRRAHAVELAEAMRQENMAMAQRAHAQAAEAQLEYLKAQAERAEAARQAKEIERAIELEIEWRRSWLSELEERANAANHGLAKAKAERDELERDIKSTVKNAHAAAAAAAASSRDDIFDAIVDLQAADGSFDLEAVLRLLDSDDAHAALASLPQMSEEGQGTLLALALLRDSCSAIADVWALLARRSMQFLLGSGLFASEADVDAVVQMLADVLRHN